MLISPSEHATPPSLHARLRSATTPAHEALEGALDMLREPLDRGRFIRLLSGFHGFHRTWERAITRHLPPALVPRPRLALIEGDLRALGLGDDALRAIAPCEAAARLGADPDLALGSVYVLEGSTLGGRMITRHVDRAPWCPSGGLRYFDPYGADTGSRWRTTLAHLSAAGGDPERIVSGAVQTFATLHAWLVGACDAAPMPAN